MKFTETLSMTETKLKRIAALSAANLEMVFSNLMHHFNQNSLRACFHDLDGKKAIGSDGIDKVTYEKDLNENLKNLVERMKRMAFIQKLIAKKPDILIDEIRRLYQKKFDKRVAY